jgi:hypothetical protein
MANEPQNGLAQPPGSATPAQEPVIHVIPDEFYGAALKKKLPKEEPPKSAAPPPQSAMPQQPAAPKPPQPPKAPKPAAAAGKKRGPWLVIVIVLVLLLGGGAAAYFALRPASTPPVNTNTAPPAPSCGNGKCEAGETTQTCETDCPKPPPICGDNVCEGSETAENCTLDCAPPSPICGDNKCDATETPEGCSVDCSTTTLPPPAPTPGKDSDSDGLTDAEETEIYGTNPNASNSDSDSYVDLNEVLNLFDPAKPTPAKLEDSSGIKKFAIDNQQAQFGVLYPTSWSVSDPASDGAVTFTARNGESVRIKRVSDNAVSQSLEQYFSARYPGVSGTSFKTRNGMNAIFSPDRLVAFLQVSDGAPIFELAYMSDGSKEIQYKVTFEMMVNSLVSNEGSD